MLAPALGWDKTTDPARCDSAALTHLILGFIRRRIGTARPVADLFRHFADRLAKIPAIDPHQQRKPVGKTAAGIANASPYRRHPETGEAIPTAMNRTRHMLACSFQFGFSAVARASRTRSQRPRIFLDLLRLVLVLHCRCLHVTTPCGNLRAAWSDPVREWLPGGVDECCLFSRGQLPHVRPMPYGVRLNPMFSRL